MASTRPVPSKFLSSGTASAAAYAETLYRQAREEETPQYRGHAHMVGADPVLIVDDNTEITAVLTYMPDSIIVLSLYGSDLMLRMRPVSAASDPVSTEKSVIEHLQIENTQLLPTQLEHAVNGTLTAVCYLIINDMFDEHCEPLGDDINAFRQVDVRSIRKMLKTQDPPSAPVRPATRHGTRMTVNSRGQGRLFRFEEDSSGDDIKDDDDAVDYFSSEDDEVAAVDIDSERDEDSVTGDGGSEGISRTESLQNVLSGRPASMYD